MRWTERKANRFASLGLEDERTTPWKMLFSSPVFLFFFGVEAELWKSSPILLAGEEKKVFHYLGERRKRSINFLFSSAFPLIWACNIVLRFFHRDSDGGESRNVFLSCARTEDEKLRCCGSDKGFESRAMWAWRWIGRSEGVLMCSSKTLHNYKLHRLVALWIISCADLSSKIQLFCHWGQTPRISKAKQDNSHIFFSLFFLR